MKIKILTLILIVFAIPVSVYLVSQAVFYIGRANGKNANLIVDLSAITSKETGMWKNLAQGGEEKGRWLLPVLLPTRNLQPKYIRIDHIFDFYDVIGHDGSGNLSFDFSKIDQLVGDITSTGSKPFFSLSYDYQSMQDWQLVVQKTIEHFSGKDGLAIDGAYYEFWNEPDFFGGYKTYGDKNYLELYSYAKNGASLARNTLPFKIGGPATTSLYKNWFDDFFKYAASRNLRVDFFSWHRYSKDMEDFETDAKNVKSWITNYPNYLNTEFIISEAGLNSENDNNYDELSGAIHAISLSTIMEQAGVKVFHFEIKDGSGNQKLWGRWGLLTNEKFGEPYAKPRYHGIEFLNKMDGQFSPVAGQGTWVRAFSSNSSSSYKTLIVNYDLDNSHPEAVPILFLGLPSHNFIYRRINFMGNVTERNVATDSATWSAVEYFDPNSAAILEILVK